jgi:hypothetical protein
MTRLRRRRLLAAKIEATSGTAESLAQGDVLYGAYDIQHHANIPFVQLPSSGSFSQEKGTLDAYAGTISFKIDLRGNGGSLPQWATVLLPACGLVATGLVYAPMTASPGASVKTLTIAVYQDGKRKMLRGASGNLQITFTAGSRIVLEFTFTGVYQAVSDQTMLVTAAAYGSTIRWAGSVFTIASAATACVNTLTINLNNTVYPRPCPTATDGSGLAGTVITDRRIAGTMDPESRLITTENVFNKWLSGTEEAFSLAVYGADESITFAAPKIQRTNIQEADRSGLEVDNIEFQCNRNTTAGDDEFTITFAEL